MKTKRLRGNRCQCPTCGLYFVNAIAFDGHRQGKYPNRTCMNQEMMMAKGQMQNKAGFWMARNDAKRALRAALAGQPPYWRKYATGS